MELKINVTDIREIVQGAHILNALIMAHKAQQDAALGTQQESEQTEKAVQPATAEQPVPDATEQQAEGEKRKRGRPPSANKAPSEKKAAAEAAAEPVGKALAGVPARDLASALDAGGEVVHENQDVQVRAAPELDAAEKAAVKGNGASSANGKGSPLEDPDLAGSFGKKTTDEEIFNTGSTGPTDEDLFAPAADAKSDDLGNKSHSELEAMWRVEGNKRGIHWMRTLIEKHKIRSATDFTREMLIDALQNPDSYMPPTVA